MTKYWIYNRKFDVTWILLPPLITLLLVLVFHNEMETFEANFSFYTWLILIVFIDVAHVYASLFRSYLVREKWVLHKRAFLTIPMVCFGVSLVLFSCGSGVFWSVLAYIAVFHFIRQQYGFMRLYSRKENISRFEKKLDTVAIYNATIYPMLFWFLNPNRHFTWFMENEFIALHSPFLATLFSFIYWAIVAFYLIHLVFFRSRNPEPINIQKLVFIATTYMSWYFGIVHYNNELIFTALNVVSHGIPYMALVYVTEFKQKNHTFQLFGSIKQSISVIVFIGTLLVLAIVEEFTWENLVWKEQISWVDLALNEIWVVPLLALPQFTHYILDAYIWRKNY